LASFHSFLTLGEAYESRPRLSGAVYRSVLRRIDEFLDKPLSKAIGERERRAGLVLKIDDRVTAIVEKLKERVHQPVSASLGHLADQPDSLLEGHELRLRRGDGQDGGVGRQVQHRPREAGGGHAASGPASDED